MTDSLRPLVELARDLEEGDGRTRRRACEDLRWYESSAPGVADLVPSLGRLVATESSKPMRRLLVDLIIRFAPTRVEIPGLESHLADLLGRAKTHNDRFGALTLHRLAAEKGWRLEESLPSLAVAITTIEGVLAIEVLTEAVRTGTHIFSRGDCRELVGLVLDITPHAFDLVMASLRCLTEAARAGLATGWRPEIERLASPDEPRQNVRHAAQACLEALDRLECESISAGSVAPPDSRELQLRRLLDEPSVSSFRYAVRLLDALGDRSAQLAETKLAAWPDHLREGERWLTGSMYARPSPARASLARSLCVHADTPRELAVALEGHRLERVTVLELWSDEKSRGLVPLLTRAAPETLHSLTLNFVPLGQAEIDELLGWKGLRGLTTLSLCPPDFDLGRLATLLDGLHARGCHLVALKLRGIPLGDEGAALIAGWPGAASLRCLEVGGCEVGPEGVATLVTAPSLDELEQLGFGGEELGGDEGALAICQVKHQSWRSLDLSSGGIGDRGAAALARCAGLSRLRSLELDANGIGPKGAALLAGSSFLGELVSLGISRNKIGPSGITALARLPRLSRLNLSDVGMGDKGVEALVQCDPLTGLEEIDISENKITSKGFAMLASSRVLPKLRRLAAGANSIKKEGAAALGASTLLHGLRSLEIGDVGLGTAGLEALLAASQAGSGPPLQLEKLDLSSNRLNRRGLTLLAQQAEHFPGMLELDLRYNEVEDEVVATVLGSGHLAAAAVEGGMDLELEQI